MSSARFVIQLLLTAQLLSTMVATVAWAESGSTKIHFEVKKLKLKNGLTLLLRPDHTVPIISYHTWYGVGSADETPGMTGLAHLFEHMMFKGTKKYPDTEFSKIIKASGGYYNAFTTHDFTAYHDTFLSEHLEKIMDLESDRMLNLNVNDLSLKNEIEVVKSERRFRVDNSLPGLLDELVYNTVFKVHPYRWPVIGWMKDLGRLTVQQCLDFYRRFYSPNNAILVISGNFDLGPAEGLVRKYYEALPPSKDLVTRQIPSEPKQSDQRVRKVNKEAQGGLLTIAYPTVESGTDDAYVFDMMAQMLGSGESSRLYRRLVYQAQVAQYVSVENESLKNAGLFTVTVGLRPGQDSENVKKMIYGELWKIRNEIASQGEIDKARNQILVSTIGGLKTVNGKAEALAFNEILFNDYTRLFNDLDRYYRIQPEMIKNVASRYLVPSKSSVAQILPKFQ